MDAMGANEQLRDLLRQTGWTYDAAARAVNRVAAEHGDVLRTNKSSITHWIGGTRPQPRTGAFIAEAISRRLGRPVHPVEIGYGDVDGNLSALPDDPVAAIATFGRADVDRRQVLGSAVYSLGALLLPVGCARVAGERAQRAVDGRIGWPEVETVKEMTVAFNRADERLGGGFGRTAVVEYLSTDVATYCGATGPEPVRVAMFGAGAQLAYLAGFKAHDIGRDNLAQRYYLYAYQLAIESGDLGHAAYIMRILAHQAYDMGHSANCVDLASASVQMGQRSVDPHTAALLVLTLAKAQAMRGERIQALASIGRAEALMSTANADEQRPSWAGMHGLSPAQFTNHVAKILADLGDLAGAEEHFTRSVAYYLDPVAQPRIHVLTTTWLAEVQCRRGYLERACGTWSDALSRMDGIRSARTRDAVRTMTRMLAPYRNRGVAAVTRLLAPVR